ncbi:MAG TPA: flagellin FliC [Planctomycetes bacterium]|nr:flagellin FliC [Planctomycetota bacterium]
MGLRIQTNVASLNAQRNLAGATLALSGSFRKLSTGLRVASASDDAAGLAISERLRAQIRSVAQSERNANDGISLVQTAEGALNEVNNILVRMRELAIQSKNGTLADQDRDTLDLEFQQVISEIDRIAKATNFSGLKLLDGSSPTISLHIGPGTTAGVDTLNISLVSTLASNLGISGLSIGTGSNVTNAINGIDAAINTVLSLRGSLGATQNRLQSTIRQLQIDRENISAAESRIRDLDVAEETANLTRNSILQQAAISILAQANVQPQAALSLLQG